MVEFLRIAKENRRRSTLIENKLANIDLYKLFRVKKYYVCEIVPNIQQTIIPIFSYTNSVKCKNLNFMPIVTI